MRPPIVIPAQAGNQFVTRSEGSSFRCCASKNNLGSSFRWNDGVGIGLRRARIVGADRTITTYT
jgi:hypothetical protein